MMENFRLKRSELDPAMYELYSPYSKKSFNLWAVLHEDCLSFICNMTERDYEKLRDGEHLTLEIEIVKE